jgi:hypothetical protein
MTDTNFIFVRIEGNDGEPTTYVIAQGRVPGRNEIRWTIQECDVFVITLDGTLLSDEIISKIAAEIVKLPVDWVETFGPRCEYLHDRIDAASVSMGRQERVGDGCPMTAWHDDLSDIEDIVSYILTGGQGSAETKIVVVIGPEHSADNIAERIVTIT